jgi:rhodanese-related sulfurtransferase
MKWRSNRAARRALLASGGAALLVGASLAAAPRGHRFDGPAMTPGQALAAARSGEVVLVDIRRPDEWAATGVPVSAVAVDMRQSDAIDRFRALTMPGQRPVALICARGVRSGRLVARLAAAGVDVIDIPEGMLGSDAGAGWLARGLPVVRP